MTLDIFVTFSFFLLPRTFKTAPLQADPKSQLFAQTRRGQEVLTKVKQFMKQHILPAEKVMCERTIMSLSPGGQAFLRSPTFDCVRDMGMSM